MKNILGVAMLLGPVVLSSGSTPPQVYGWSAPNLVAARERLARGDPALVPALKALRHEADGWLTQTPRSVMDKPLVAASGDKHDYFSYGPYWWPDPTKTDGLPYIRRDGEVNPASRQGTDHGPLGRTISAIETLGLAYWFTHDERYAAQAARLARVWFLDRATRMTPNLQHAQAIPGRSDGRGIGLIEANRLGSVPDSLALLAGSPAWTENDRTALTRWLEAYYRWLTTSGNGSTESKERNNHGSWYDAQASHLALALGRPADAKAILERGLKTRLGAQVEPDGAQPFELARTKSFNYSLFNLEALFACAQLADAVGLDWWHHATPDGRSLRAALAFLAPYLDPKKPWIKKDLAEGDRARLLPLIAIYLEHDDDARLRKAYAKSGATAEPAARWRLLWPAP